MAATPTTTTTIPAGTYVSDPIHSHFGFAVKHAAVSTFRGAFGDVKATLRSDGQTLSLDGVAQVESVEVRFADLKGHLLAPDFFDAAQHPEIAFRSNEIRVDGERVEVDGELRIKGIANHVTATGTITEASTGPAGHDVVGVSLETTIDRTAYGLDWNMNLPNGKPALNTDVTITVELELGRTDEEPQAR